jgi:hypothetical protein
MRVVSGARGGKMDNKINILNKKYFPPQLKR